MAPSFAKLFPAMPEALRKPLEESYVEIKRTFYEEKYEPTELNAAKFSEVVYRIIEWHTSGGGTSGTYTAFGTTIRNFEVELRKFESMTAFDHSIRMHIPRILVAIYSIRNHRGVGHVGTGVDPNYMDSVFVASACDWILSDLVRHFYGVKPAAAQKIVTDIVTRKVPLIWSLGKTKRVLDDSLSISQQTLVLLYSEYGNEVPSENLCKWVEYSNLAVYRTKVLRNLHHDRLIEFDYKGTKKATLTPKGKAHVEKNIDLSI